MAVAKFNQWLGENEGFDREDLERLSDMGLDDRSPNEKITEMIDEWYSDHEVSKAMDVLSAWMEKRLGRAVGGEADEDWEDELRHLSANFDVSTHGVFEVMLLQSASDAGINF